MSALPRSRTATLLLWIGLAPLREGRGRSIVAAFAIALGIALGFAVYLVNRSAADEVSAATRSLFGEADLIVQGGADGFDEDLYPIVARMSGVAHVSPVIEVLARVSGHRRSLDVVGIDPFRARFFEPALVDTLAEPRTAALDDEAILVSAAAARELHIKEGDVFQVQVGLEWVTLKVAAIVPTLGGKRAEGVMDIAAAQWRLHRLGKLTRLDIKLENPAHIRQVRDAIAHVLPPGMRVTTPAVQSDEALRISRAYRTNLSALALVALFTGGFLVYSTQSLAVLRRRRELGLLHAIGLTRREELWLILASAAGIGAVGAFVGTLLGALAAVLGLRALGGDLGAGYFSDVEFSTHFHEWVAFFLLGVLVAVASAVAPALEAYRIPPAFALKSMDVAETSSRSHGWMGACCLVLAGIALMLPAVDGLPLPGYVAIALLLIGAVFMMPLVTHFLLRLLPNSRSAVFGIVIAHLRGAKRFVSASLASILVSFSLMVAMAIMVTSFRTSLDQWMARLLQADIYVRAGPGQESAFIDSAHLASLKNIAGVMRVEAARSTTILWKGERLVLAARPIDEARPAKDMWLVSQTSTPAPAGALSVWVSEAAMDLNGLTPGTEIALPINGRPIRAFIRGVWRDYEHQTGAIALNYDTYVRVSGDRRIDGVRLWLRSPKDKNVVLQELTRRLPNATTLDIRMPIDVRATALRAFDRTFAVTYLLEALAVLIGVFGIGATSSAQVLARRAEFGVLRSLGLTRGQIGTLLAVEGAMLGLIGAIAGLLLGGLISLILVYVVNRQSFHWSMDVYIPGMTLGVLSVVLVSAAAVTALLSGRQAMSDAVVNAVKEDW